MKTIITVSAVFNCSLERAFKTPILGDATQFLVGYGPVPAVVRFSDDETWGKPGGHRIPHSAKSLLSPGGPIGIDRVYERIENRYWKWGVTEFSQWSMGFTAFMGEMHFAEVSPNGIAVTWTYTLISNSAIAYPAQWLFGQLFWRGQMRHGIIRMKQYAESNTPFLYA